MNILKKCNHIHIKVAVSDEREEKDMMREREGENGYITSEVMRDR